MDKVYYSSDRIILGSEWQPFLTREGSFPLESRDPYPLRDSIWKDQTFDRVLKVKEKMLINFFNDILKSIMFFYTLFSLKCVDGHPH